MDFRIVELRKGDCAVGFRVQENTFSPRAGGNVWRNRGRICYSVEQARIQRDWIIRLAEMVRPATEIVVVE